MRFYQKIVTTTELCNIFCSKSHHYFRCTHNHHTQSVGYATSFIFYTKLVKIETVLLLLSIKEIR